MPFSEPQTPPPRISQADRSEIDALMDATVPDLRYFNWAHLQQMRTERGPKLGELAVELNPPERRKVYGRYASAAPAEVTKIDKRFVELADGRVLPIELCEHLIQPETSR